jgi:hypothetical protein
MLLAGEPAPAGLHIVTLEDGWPRPLPEGLADLTTYVRERGPRLIILDTLGRLRRAGNGRRNAYAADVDELGPLQGLAQGAPALAVLAIHHTRKATAADYLEAASGSFGVVGTADAVLTLSRARGQADAELKVTGRDVAEQELALQFDGTRGAWTALGSAYTYRQSQEKRDILDALQRLGEATAPKELAETVGRPVPSVKKALLRLQDEGLVSKTAYARYTLSQAGFLCVCGYSGNGGNGRNTGYGGNGGSEPFPTVLNRSEAGNGLKSAPILEETATVPTVTTVPSFDEAEL